MNGYVRTRTVIVMLMVTFIAAVATSVALQQVVNRSSTRAAYAATKTVESTGASGAVEATSAAESTRTTGTVNATGSVAATGAPKFTKRPDGLRVPQGVTVVANYSVDCSEPLQTVRVQRANSVLATAQAGEIIFFDATGIVRARFSSTVEAIVELYEWARIGKEAAEEWGEYKDGFHASIHTSPVLARSFVHAEESIEKKDLDGNGRYTHMSGHP